MLNLTFKLPVTRKQGLPVLPARLPLLGHTLYTFGDVIAYFQEAARRLGPLFWMQSGDQWSLVCMGEPGFELLKNRTTSSEFIQQRASDFIGESVLAQDGAMHRHLRSAMSGPFTPRGLTSSGAATLAAEVIESRVASMLDGTFSPLAETQAFALDIIFRIMGIERSELSAWNHHYREFILAAVPLTLDLPYSPRWRARRGKRWLDTRLSELIAAARGGRLLQGVAAAIMAARDDEGKPLEDKELVENLRLLALAGHETSASIMAWMVITLAQQPELWEQLCAEATAAPGLPCSPEELKRHPFAEALFREALRLYPPVAFTAREALEELTLHGVQVPRGTVVTVPIGAYGRDPALFPEPLRFDPSRWLGKRSPPSPVELAPFGGGPHFCLGYHLAWLEGVQFATALAREAMRRKVRLQLARGPEPVLRYIPFGRPPKGTRIELARA